MGFRIDKCDTTQITVCEIHCHAMRFHSYPIKSTSLDGFERGLDKFMENRSVSNRACSHDLLYVCYQFRGSMPLNASWRGAMARENYGMPFFLPCVGPLCEIECLPKWASGLLQEDFSDTIFT